MANKATLINQILSEYSKITVLDILNDSVMFELNGEKYEIFMFNDNMVPIVCTVNSEREYPHFMFNNVEKDGKCFRSICLFESGTIIEYIHTDVEKIRLCIEQLINLTEMSQNRIIEEYQKEFLVYWEHACGNKNKYSSHKYQLFLDDEESHQWLEQQIFKNDYVRLTKTERYFNDNNKKLYVDRIPVLYLPLKDIRKLVPPLAVQPWGANEIGDIINGATYQRISNDAYQEIVNLNYSRKAILLVFKLNSFCFGCVVEFKNSGTSKLLYKFESQIEKVIPISIKRCDFEFLNKQIGNQVCDKRINIVGAGSLGSYVAGELVRSGYRNITIIDKDIYEYENVFRHRVEHFSWGYSKSVLLEFKLNMLHPELNVKSINKYLKTDNIEECEIDTADIIIFTVGSSDVQLCLNEIFVKHEVHKPIIHTWLEHDGETSHVAVLNNFNDGCFECLFTDKQGNMCGNIINRANEKYIQYIRNGCGGTRVPYGNKTLLNASALVLKALNNLGDDNVIYSYLNDTVITEGFPKNERCNCCGIRK